jgi:NTP pyrophosphatase (non-canonical NTP hydrolase)
MLVAALVWACLCWHQAWRRWQAAEKQLRLQHSGMMTMNAYQALAMRSAKPQSDSDAFNHAMLGMMDELGELAKHWKAHLYYDKPFERKYVRQELGDMSWFHQRAATAAGLTLEEVAKINIEKLRLRYPSKFSTAAALARADERGGA